MNKKFNGTTVETDGVRSIAGGGTGSTTAGDALTALGAATSAQGALADTAIQPNTSATLSSLSVDDTDPSEGESVQMSPSGITLYSGAVISFGGTGIATSRATTRTNLGIGVRGQISKMTSGTITIATQGVYQSTGLTGTLDATTANGMVLGTTDTFAVKNTSGATRIFRIYASMDAGAGNNETLGIKLAKNGTAIDETECRANTNNNAFAKLVTSWMVSMANNDEIALFVANHSSTTSLAFQRGRIIASVVD